MKKIIFTLLITTLLSGCASSYYGYDKATWDSMSPEEKENAINDVNKLMNYGNEVDSKSAETQSIIDRAGAFNR